MGRPCGARSEGLAHYVAPAAPIGSRICRLCEEHRLLRESSPSYGNGLRKPWTRTQRKLEDIRSDDIIAKALEKSPPLCTRKATSHQEFTGSQLVNQRKKRVNFASFTPPDSGDDASKLSGMSSTSYCEPKEYDNFKKKPFESRSPSPDLSELSSYESQKRRDLDTKINSRLNRLIGSTGPKPWAGDGLTMLPRSSSSFSTSDRDVDRLLDDFDSLGLTSDSSKGSHDKKKPTPVEAEPRVVKPRDARNRASVKKMLVYPPQGQAGEPLTLLKKWSNIDCHVTGDQTRGYRYTVYYLQKFESHRWQANPKTGSPFRSLEDTACSSTDHG